MRRSVLLITPILAAAVLAGCSSTTATPSAAGSSHTATSAPSPTSAVAAVCAKLGSQSWKIDAADSGTTEDWLKDSWSALPSDSKLTGDLVDAAADLTVIDGVPDVSSPDAATYKKFLGLLKEDVQKVESDCQAAGVTLDITLSPQPTS